MLKVVVFDCDGVMFDSKRVNEEYYNSLLTHFGCPAMDAEELEFVHAHNVMDSVSHIFRNRPELSLEGIHQYRASLDYSSFLKHMIMEPDLPELLEKLQGKYHLAISTNRSDTMDQLLEDYGLTKYFDKVMTATTAKKPKPAPDALWEILEHFNCSAAEAIHIGDTWVDEEHAKAAGVQLIAFRNKNLKADYYVDRFLSVLELPPFSST